MDMPISRSRSARWRPAVAVVVAASAIATLGYLFFAFFPSALGPSTPSSSPQHAIATGEEPSFKVPAAPSLRHIELLPGGYSPESTRAWPLILYLHGSGWRGDDIESLRGIDFLQKAQRERDFPFFVVAPQCPRGRDWTSLLGELNRILDDVAKKHRIDSDRLYCTGSSMGGFGTWAYAAAYPHKFAAIVPVCGGGTVPDMERISHLPIWVFHGANDQVVPIARSAELVAELRRRNGGVRFTIFPVAGHDVGAETYDNPELYAWLLRHKRVAAERQSDAPARRH